MHSLSRYLDASIFYRLPLPEVVLQNLLICLRLDWLLFIPGAWMLSCSPSLSTWRIPLSLSCVGSSPSCIPCLPLSSLIPLFWWSTSSSSSSGKIHELLVFWEHCVSENVFILSSFLLGCWSKYRIPDCKLFSSREHEGFALLPSSFPYYCEEKEAFQSGSLENLLSVPRVVTFSLPWHESVFIYCAGPSMNPWTLESCYLDLWKKF